MNLLPARQKLGSEAAADAPTDACTSLRLAFIHLCFMMDVMRSVHSGSCCLDISMRMDCTLNWESRYTVSLLRCLVSILSQQQAKKKEANGILLAHVTAKALARPGDSVLIWVYHSRKMQVHSATDTIVSFFFFSWSPSVVP